MNWKDRYSGLITDDLIKYGVEVILNRDTDKSDWDLSNMEERYSAIYTIHMVPTTGIPTSVVLKSTITGDSWSMSIKFLKKHFLRRI